MLQMFSFNVYALLDPGATFYFVTSLVAMKFIVLPNLLIEPFSVTTVVDESVVDRIVFRSYPILFTNRVISVDLVELDMVDFDVILGMYWFHACFASIYFRTRVVKFQFPNEPVIEWKGETLSLEV